MKNFVSILLKILGVIGVIGSHIAMYFPVPLILILTILKIVGYLDIPYFAWVTEIGAISTGLWVLIIGLIAYLVSLIAVSAGMEIGE